jgi:serine protease AprX
MWKFRLLMAPVLACLLLGPGLGVQAAAAATPVQVVLDSSLKIHPLLQYGAQTDPTRVVRVIVQKNSRASGGGLSGLLGGLLGGGSQSNIVEEFTVIPASVMDVTLGSIPALARDSSVRYISPDGPVQVIPGALTGGLVGGLVGGLLGALLGGGGKPQQPQSTVSGSVSRTKTTGSVDSSHLATTYPIDTGAQSVWAGQANPAATGQGITVAILDSGVDISHPDLTGHVLAVNVNQTAQNANDGYGHGTHVAGVVGGQDPTGQYDGIAPKATVLSVKLSDDTGAAYESDVLRGLEWVELHRAAYHIRAINLSVSTSVPASYATSPIDAAVEHLWSEGVTVVAAAGNMGNAQDAVWYAPGNDPLVITVGCLDENQTVSPSDDSLCPISSRGVTEDGFAKPDLLAPGRKIVSALAGGINGPTVLTQEFPDRITDDGHHLRLSGTSMSAPMVTGAVALLLQNHPNLTPDQIKQLLVNSASAYPGQPDQAGTLNIAAALSAAAHPPTAGLTFPVPVGGTISAAGSHAALWDGSRWSSTYWDGSRWVSAYLDSANWSGSRFDNSRWNVASFDGSRWVSAYWDNSHWNVASFDGSNWVNAYWDNSHWNNSHWNLATFDGSSWDNSHWNNSHWNGSTWD